MAWISTQKRLPKVGKTVDIYRRETGREIDYILNDEGGGRYFNPINGGEWFLEFNTGKWNSVTHWRYPPDPPGK